MSLSKKTIAHCVRTQFNCEFKREREKKIIHLRKDVMSAVARMLSHDSYLLLLFCVIEDAHVHVECEK